MNSLPDGVQESPGVTISENEENKLVCHDEEGGQDIPGKGDIVNSITRGPSLNDFAEKIACNATEICKWSEEGTVRKPQL